MMEHAPVLLIIVPMVSALLGPLVGARSRLVASWIPRFATAAALLFSVVAFARSLETGPWHYHVGGWAPPWGIEIVVDPLSGLMACLVSGVALLVSFYSAPYLERWTARRTAVFHSVYCLLVSGLLGISVTGDLFNLYVFLEISSLSAYALLSTGGSRAIVATFRYLLVGTVAASFYLIGVGFLYATTGTLNMADTGARLHALDSPVVVVATCFIVIGLAIKAALYPLHGWLPDTYTYAPGPVVGFIAAVMTKVSAYALYRILFFVFAAGTAPGEPLLFLGWAAAISVVAGAVMALAQKDVQRMLAYSSVSQMGYIIMGVAMGTPMALTGAVLHVVNHAVMKGCLFMAVNGVQWKMGIFRVRDFAGLGRRLPFTMGAFTIAALSMVGLPPTAGFFSKYYLVVAAVEEGNFVFVVALVLSSLLGAVYLFRVLEYAYLAPGAAKADPRELPFAMLVPVLALAACVLLFGVFNQALVDGLVRPGLPS
jgi:multicomponent Na+:H+ antiporter subunit D